MINAFQFDFHEAQMQVEEEEAEEQERDALRRNLRMHSICSLNNNFPRVESAGFFSDEYGVF